MPSSPETIAATVAAVYKDKSRAVFATLVRLLGDIDLAEDALHDAFFQALRQWTVEGVPTNPTSWLISTGRFKAIDRLRRQGRFDRLPADMANLEAAPLAEQDLDGIEDDQLRLIFTCCHPSLSVEAQIALSLREVCGLTTESIAHAFLIKPSTLAQRIVRAKNKIRKTAIPFEVPHNKELKPRLDAVRQVIYLIFNEGYTASSGDRLLREDLAEEAIRLGRLMNDLLPDSETQGLLALMLLHDSRRLARTDEWGDVILLEHQDRRVWDAEKIAEGCDMVQQSLATRHFGPYTVQAAIAAVQAEAPAFDQIDWPQIIGLYDVLLQMNPNPVVELNRAVAVAMRDGAAVGLKLVDALLNRGDLDQYRLVYAAKADLHRRLGQSQQARSAYERALELAGQDAERRFLEKRLAELALEN